MYILKILLCSIVFVLSAGNGFTLDAREMARNYIQEKSKYTGSLDVYDEALDKVRNLKWMEWLADDSEQNVDSIEGLFRDLGNGDILVLQMNIVDGAIDRLEILEVKQKASAMNKQMTDKTFTKEEVQKAIKNYIDQKSKFTKTYDVYDPKKEAFLKLEFDGFVGEMRTFGVLYIQSVSMLETQTNEKLIFDFTAKNTQGKLKITKVKPK